MFRNLFIALLGTVFTSVSAVAQSGNLILPNQLYLQGAVGQSTFWDIDINGGGELEFDFLAFFISGAVGYRVSPTLRAEAEWLFESADIDGSVGDLEVIRGTVSAYVDLAPTSMMGFSNVIPYVGGGVGVANIELLDDQNELTFHAEAGLSIPIANRVEFVPGFRFEYIFLDDDDFNADDDLWITQLRAGLRYNF